MSGLWSIRAFAFGQNRSNVDVVHAGLLEGEPHELAAALDRGPGRDRVAEPLDQLHFELDRTNA